MFFGVAFYAQKQKQEVQQFKRGHPFLFALAVFMSGEKLVGIFAFGNQFEYFALFLFPGYFLVYQMGCIVVFLLGVCLPIAFAFVHASLR